MDEPKRVIDNNPNCKIGLPLEQFDAVFPFHMAFNPDMSLHQVGSVLHRIAPELEIGKNVTQFFSMVLPDGGNLSYEWLIENRSHFVLLEHKSTQLKLRGGMQLLESSGLLLFLCSPWLTDADQLEKEGLDLDDFAVHDPMTDLLMVLQLNKQIHNDTAILIRRLKVREGELSESNLLLEERVRERTNKIKATMNELERMGNSLNELVSGSPTVLYRLDPETMTPSYISPNASVVTGWSSQDFENDPLLWYERIHPEDKSKAIVTEEQLAKLKAGAVLERKYRFRHKNGKYRILSDNMRFSGDSHSPVAVGSLWDITELTEMEARLREGQTLKAVGQLTGGLAHDFNNLLGIVVGNLDEMAELLPADEGLRERHQAALNAALRGAEVTRSLLAVGRRQPLDVQSHNLNELITEMLPLVRSSVGSAITVQTDLNDDEVLTRLDVAGMNKAVLHLVINARDAMQEEAGDRVLMLRTRIEPVDIEPGGGLSPGLYAVLEVEDTGTGMSEAVRAQALEPFFTTKDLGKGTGLGLSMVHGYATQLGGTLRIHNSLQGGGTIVQLYLPLDSESVEVAAAPSDNAARKTHVLVVDDEVDLCDLAAIWLESLGYVVTTAHSPAEALEHLACESLDILFTDIVMPGGMDGVELAEAAKRRRPDIEIVLTSGYALRLHEGVELPGPLINKPYRKSDLEQVFEKGSAGAGEHAH
jgi:signal transduction histidine kinase/CheY-like chemotaxis protein